MCSKGRAGQWGSGRAWALSLLCALLVLGGCAEVRQPKPTAAEIEEVQLAASRRHPFQSWNLERASRVFIRLLATVPQSQGQTYPFLGFNWWLTEGDRVVIDNVWSPSPAADAGLRQGDIIVGVNNWPLQPWIVRLDEKIRLTRELTRDLFWGQRRHWYIYRGYSEGLNLLALPGEVLVALLLDFRHVAMEARGRYLSGPVELLIERQGEKFTVTLYPQHLPAEYALLVDTHDQKINAFAAPGRIILTSRMVAFCLNDDELALVIGHELAHQVLGHLVRGAGQRRLGGLAGKVWAVTGLFATQSITRLAQVRTSFWLRDTSPPFVRDAVVSVFSREDEREADLYGLWFAYQAGYDIDRGLAVWDRLAAIRHDPFETTEFLDSHPAPAERLARLKIAARYFQTGQAAKVFLQSRDLAHR